MRKIYSLLLFALLLSPLPVLKAQSPCMCTQLDGVDEYMHTNFANYNFSNFTVEMWINVPTYGTNIHYFSLYQNSYIVLGDYDNGSFSTWADGLNPIDIGASGTYGTVNAWHHVAFTYDGTRQKLYMDGVLNLDVLSSGALTINSSLFNQGLNIGSRYTSNTQFVNGLIDEVRIWNIARTQLEIQGAMGVELVGNEAGLVGYWPMNDGPGSPIASDMTANNNDLTLSNMEVVGDWVAQCPFIPIAPFNVSYLPNDTICNGDTLMLTATGRDSVIWLPNAFLNVDTGNVVQYYPFASGTVTAVGWLNGDPNPDTVEINVVVNPSFNSVTFLTICEGDSAFAGGAYQTVAGFYTESFSTLNGCDSIISVNLSVNPNFATTDSATICSGDSILLGGAFQSVAGTYVDVWQAQNGCDSVVSTMLSVSMPDTSVSVAGGTYTANASGASYQWFICQGPAVPNATGQSFSPLSNGQYSVQVTQNGCTAMSACFDFAVGVPENALSEVLSVYPNPVQSEVFVAFANSVDGGSYSVLDELGRLILEGDIENGSLIARINLRALSAGVYHLRVKTENGTGVYRVVKD